MKILFEFLEYPWALNNAGTVCTNSHWYPFRDSVFREVSGDLSALVRFSGIVNKLKPDCYRCNIHIDRCASSVSAKIEKLPKYSEV